MYRYADANYNDEKKEHESVDLSVLSSTASFIETEHARLRRKQRCIDQKDLTAAMKYGDCAPHYWGSSSSRNGKKTQKSGVLTTTTDCVRYTYRDIVYIVNETTKAEVTCYARPITLDPIPISPTIQKSFNEARIKVRHDLNSWTSNTVMVIDTSGSMRISDMWGTRNRLKSVWFSVALDFLAQQNLHEKRTVILSDVLQTGKEATELYSKIAQLLSQKNIHQFIGIGQEISLKSSHLFKNI